MTQEQEEAEIREALEKYGRVVTNEVIPGSWICKVTDNGNRTLFTTAGYPSQTKLAAMQLCASALEDGFQAGGLDDLPEEALLTKLQHFGDVHVGEVDGEWICEVSASKFDKELYSSFRDGEQHLTKAAAMRDCLNEILRCSRDADGFLEASERYAARPAPTSGSSM